MLRHSESRLINAGAGNDAIMVGKIAPNDSPFRRQNSEANNQRGYEVWPIAARSQ